MKLSTKFRSAFVVMGMLSSNAWPSDHETIIVYSGYITQVHCKGTLYTSSVGNDGLVNLEAIPKNLGCGVLLQSKKEGGFTDVLLKTSTGDMHRIVEVRKASFSINPSQLEIHLSPDVRKEGS